MQKIDAAGLRKAAGPAQTCRCALGPCAGWESFTEERWPKDLMRPLGTLRQADNLDPGTDEHHPAGTRYESPQAPVAVGFYPYNRCDVYACDHCSRVLMRYTEFGGYYVDHRVRQVDAALIV